MFEHVADARADRLALAAQRRDLAGGTFRIGEARAQRGDLLREPRVVLRGLRLLRAKARHHCDKQFDLLLETIDRLDINRSQCCLFDHRARW